MIYIAVDFINRSQLGEKGNKNELKNMIIIMQLSKNFVFLNLNLIHLIFIL